MFYNENEKIPYPSQDPDNNPSLWIRITSIAVGFIAGLIICALCSCGSSKSVCGVTIHTSDSLEQFMKDSISVIKRDSIADLHISEKEQSSLSLFNEDEEETETITEHILQITDSAGTTTITTDRTIKRKRNISKAKIQQEIQRVREEETKIRLSYLDSISNNLNSYKHTQISDSTSYKKEKKTNSVYSTSSIIENIRLLIKYTIILTVLICIAYLGYISCKGKI